MPLQPCTLQEWMFLASESYSVPRYDISRPTRFTPKERYAS